MSTLTLPAGFAFPQVLTDLSPHDTMFDGRDDHYLGVGVSAINIINSSLGETRPESILDLPCGFGRVTRMLRAQFPNARITACDLDRPAVDFTAAAFQARGVYSISDFSKLELGEKFDLIWVGSLLTHMPEHVTRKFLDFAIRHMKPAARLVVTTHGEYVANRLPATTYGLTEAAARGLHAEYLTSGYGYRGYDGDPLYGISLTARAWFENLLAGSGLRLQAYHERGWDRHQDAIVLRRVPADRTGFWRSRLRRTAAVHFEDDTCAQLLPAIEQAKQDAQNVPGFDEQWYCENYPDVGAAKSQGVLASGLSHYRDFGWKEGRAPFDPAQSFTRRTGSRPAAWLNGVGGVSRVVETWSVSPEDRTQDAGWYWLAHPAVRARSNKLATGRVDQDAYGRFAVVLQELGIKLPIAQSISIGCGFGNLERDLSARGLIGEIDAYDIASGAIAEARRQAGTLGLKNIHYHEADLETIDLSPSSVDVVFAHSSVHHVERLEALYAKIKRALRRGGVFHLHEYIGPTRFQWTDEQLRLGNEFLTELPARLRRQPDGQMKTLTRPTIDEMIAADPSEAVRSAELVRALDPYFEIIEYRALGGALAHIALGGIAQNFDPENLDDMAHLERLFALEDSAMERGVIGSDFATIIATPRKYQP